VILNCLKKNGFADECGYMCTAPNNPSSCLALAVPATNLIILKLNPDKIFGALHTARLKTGPNQIISRFMDIKCKTSFFIHMLVDIMSGLLELINASSDFLCYFCYRHLGEMFEHLSGLRTIQGVFIIFNKFHNMIPSASA